jgi:hypothetical protein
MTDVDRDLAIGFPVYNSFVGIKLKLALELNNPVAHLRGTWPPDVETSFFESYRLELPQPKQPSFIIG